MFTIHILVIIKMNNFNYSVSMSQFYISYYHGIREESSDEFCDQTACERNILSYNFFAKPQNWRILQLIKRMKFPKKFYTIDIIYNFWKFEYHIDVDNTKWISKIKWHLFITRWWNSNDLLINIHQSGYIVKNLMK